MSSPINLTSRPFFTLPTLKQQGRLIPGIFLCLATEHLEQCRKNALFHLSAPVAGQIFSISQVDFARLIKSSSLMSCLTSPSLLLGAYCSTGATGQTDCCPAGMGLAARQEPEAHSPTAPQLLFESEVWSWKGWSRERIEVIPSSSGLLPREEDPEQTPEHRRPPTTTRATVYPSHPSS